VFKAKKTIEDIYLKMLYIEFREYELRRRVDNLQNTLNKISERILERKLARGL
jgi:predicted translin family RNA/ssDNA-binding protein